MKTDGRVAGGQRDDDADRAGPRDEGERHGGEGHVRFRGRVLSLLVGGTALVFQHRETRVRDDQATRDLQGRQVEAEETHDERATDREHRQDGEHVHAGLPRLRAHRGRSIACGESCKRRETTDRIGDRGERQDRGGHSSENSHHADNPSRRCARANERSAQTRRAPKMAVPRRTIVAPSAMAHSRSRLIPIDSARSDSSMPRRAAASSLRSRSCA